MGWVLRLLGAALSGTLLVLALPPVGVWPLGWLALVPLLIACRGTRFITGFGLAVISCLVVAQLSISGIFFAHRSFEGEATWIKLGSAIFGAVVGVTAAIWTEVKQGDLRKLAGLAAFAVLFEAATLRVLPVTLALTQPTVAGMRMLASVTGIWGIAYLLWLTNLLIADSIGRRKIGPVVAIAAPITLLLAGGPLWVSKASRGSPAAVVLVQADENHTPRDLLQMSGTDPQALAVWPEFGGLIDAPSGNAGKLRSLSMQPQAPAFVTSFRDGHSPLPHNVAALFEKGHESARYAKRLLFGSEKQMHSEGFSAVSVPWNGVSVGLNICFDSCAPGVVRESALPEGVKLIALPTIDPPATHDWIAAMHAAYTPFRSAEEGIPVARADGYAYSMVTDASGEVLEEVAPGMTARRVEVPLVRRWTLYRQMGNYFLPVCALLVLAAMVPLRRKHRSTPGSALTEPPPPASVHTPKEPLSLG